MNSSPLVASPGNRRSQLQNGRGREQTAKSGNTSRDGCPPKGRIGMTRRARRVFKATHPLKYLLATLGVTIIPQADVESYKARVLTKFHHNLTEWVAELGLKQLKLQWLRALAYLIGAAALGFSLGWLTAELSAAIVGGCVAAMVAIIHIAVASLYHYRRRVKKAETIGLEARWRYWTATQVEDLQLHINTGQRATPELPHEVMLMAREIADRDPKARFEVEYLYEDPVLHVVREVPGKIERYAIAIWGEPKKFTFRDSLV